MGSVDPSYHDMQINRRADIYLHTTFVSQSGFSLAKGKKKPQPGEARGDAVERIGVRFDSV
jgi:hypothetical protein